LFRVPWHNRADPILLRQRALAGIEAAVGLALVLVEAVTAEAGVREKRSDIAVILRLFRQRQFCGGKGRGWREE